MNTSDNTNLDFLRATAVLYVFVSHLTFFRGIYFLGPLRIVPLGYWGVFIFFVHTCLVLMLSLERQWMQGGASKIFWTFMVRRCFRIFPLSILVVSLIALLHIPQKVVEHGSFVGASPTRWELVSNLMLIQNLTTGLSILGPLWSLPYEMQMYLFLPLLFLLFRSRNYWWVVVLWLCSVGSAVIALRHPSIPDFLLYVPCFLPGVLAYKLMRSDRAKLPAFLWPIAILALTVLFFLKTGWPYPWAACFILGLAVPRFSPLSTPWLVKACQVVAKYSYGIYLTHFFAIWFAFVKLFAIPRTMRWGVFLLCAAGLPVLFYRLLEEPMIRVGKRLADRIVEASTRESKASPTASAADFS